MKSVTSWCSGRLIGCPLHPRSQLMNTAEGFIYRALSLTSHEHRDDIKNVIWSLLKKTITPQN
jgi:hypothetical protein